jgi:hypothetical protein
LKLFKTHFTFIAFKQTNQIPLNHIPLHLLFPALPLNNLTATITHLKFPIHQQKTFKLLPLYLRQISDELKLFLSIRQLTKDSAKKPVQTNILGRHYPVRVLSHLPKIERRKS